MNLATLQNLTRESLKDKPSFANGLQLMIALTEEIGEVALFEKAGSKVYWERKPSVASLAKELGQLANLVAALANCYGIDLDQQLESTWRSGED